MLLQQSIKQNDVVSLRLVSGEEIIAKVSDTAADHIVITKPLVVNIAADRSGNIGVQMLPYFLLTGDPDAKLTIKDTHIVTKTIANEQARNGYIQNTTGLSMASGAPSGLMK